MTGSSDGYGYECDSPRSRSATAERAVSAAMRSHTSVRGSPVDAASRSRSRWNALIAAPYRRRNSAG